MMRDRIKAAERVGHELECDEDGDVNVWAHDGRDPHNGPRCTKCDQSWCYSCNPFGPAGGCQAGYGSWRNAVLWLALRAKDKAERALRAFVRELRK